MSNIELLIKIPEEVHKSITNGKNYISYQEYVEEAIKNGISLPKGHGDLKDMGNLQYVFDLTREDSIYSGKDIEQAVKSMKSIIEADKENEDV